MRLVQSARNGGVQLEETVRPASSPTQVLVDIRSSLITGTSEARARHLATALEPEDGRSPSDVVRKVVRRATAYGMRDTFDQIKSWVSEDMPLGHSAAGLLLEVGEAVNGVRPGQRVAVAGVPHSELGAVDGDLVVRLPDHVSFEEGAFAAVGSVALNALRMSKLEAGSRLLVVGLDLMGQLAVRLAIASGATVVGLDPNPAKQEMVRKTGARATSSDIDGWARAIEWTGSEGFDTVIVTTSTESSEPLKWSVESLRYRGLIVLVGETGLQFDRRSVYDKELTVKVARSLESFCSAASDGVGGKPSSASDWTIKKNMEAVVGLMASGRINVQELISHRFAFEDAVKAFDLMERDNNEAVGVILEYPSGSREETVIDLTSDEHAWSPVEGDGAGLVGCDQRSQEFLLPAARLAGFERWTVVGSSDTSVNSRIAQDYGFERTVSDPSQVISDPTTATVFLSAQNDTHASLTMEALRAGKSVFCAQPLAVTEEELDDVVETYREFPGVLMVGFNRRWSQPVSDVNQVFELSETPIQILYRVNAGTLPESHHLKNPKMGGRLLGEAGHYIDTCNAIVGHEPTQVLCITSGSGELWLEEDFSITIGYSNGSQAVVVYSASSSNARGRERLEVLGAGSSIVIDDYASLRVDGPPGTTKRRYRPTDKGHRGQMRVFAELLEGTRDRREIARDAIVSSRVTIAAVQSAMTRSVVALVN